MADDYGMDEILGLTVRSGDPATEIRQLQSALVRVWSALVEEIDSVADRLLRPGTPDEDRARFIRLWLRAATSGNAKARHAIAEAGNEALHLEPLLFLADD